jgi:hypothetical protein
VRAHHTPAIRRAASAWSRSRSPQRTSSSRHAVRRLDRRTDLPGGHHPTLIKAIREVLFPFGDDAIVHSGHGESTTIGEERRSNRFS